MVAEKKMAKKISETARFFKDIGNPVRLKIILFLMEGEKCLCEILPNFKIAQPTMSRHLSVLKEHKIIKCNRDGNRIFYTICDDRIPIVLKALNFKISNVKKVAKCQRKN